MNEDHRTIARAQARTTRTRVILGIAAGSFLLGALIVAFFLWDGDFTTDGILRVKSDDEVAAPAAPATSAAPTSSPTPDALEPVGSAAAQQARQAQRVDDMVVQQGGLDQRVAAMEQRLARLDLRAQAAAGNAARAEGLLIAFAARRAIERGAPLGYLADQLRLRFGDARPNAVATIIEAQEEPVTLDQLLARLEGLAPELVAHPPGEGAFTWLGRELSQLFVVRSETAPSPQPQRRLDRARLFLESGRTRAAIAEVRNLPNAAEATNWIEDAERYAAVQQALENIETAAVLEPRNLRDGSGNRIEQLSPASEASN